MPNDKPSWDCYPEHLRPSEPPDTERTPPEFNQELMGEFAGVDWGVEEEPECPECAYEKETGRAASVPHHCDQMAIDAGYYPEEDS